MSESRKVIEFRKFFTDLYTAHGLISQAQGAELGRLAFDDNQWTGFVDQGDFDRHGNFIALGPTPPGWPSQLSSIVLLLGFKKLSQTPEGVKAIQAIALEYLKSIGKIISTLSQSSSAHVISCAINQYVACTIYQRLGLMSPKDAMQTRAWLDHQTGEAMLTERAGFSLGALTTLVNSTTSGGEESATGLGAFAKILSKA